MSKQKEGYYRMYLCNSVIISGEKNTVPEKNQSKSITLSLFNAQDILSIRVHLTLSEMSCLRHIYILLYIVILLYCHTTAFHGIYNLYTPAQSVCSAFM